MNVLRALTKGWDIAWDRYIICEDSLSASSVKSLSVVVVMLILMNESVAFHGLGDC